MRDALRVLRLELPLAPLDAPHCLATLRARARADTDARRVLVETFGGVVDLADTDDDAPAAVPTSLFCSLVVARAKLPEQALPADDDAALLEQVAADARALEAEARRAGGEVAVLVDAMLARCRALRDDALVVACLAQLPEAACHLLDTHWAAGESVGDAVKAALDTAPAPSRLGRESGRMTLGNSPQRIFRGFGGPRREQTVSGERDAPKRKCQELYPG